MKNKTLVYIIILLVIVLGIGAKIYFVTENGKLENEDTQDIEKGGETNALANDDFSMILPKGWKGSPAPAGAIAMAVNVDENVTDTAAAKINFKSYIAVSFDTLQERSREEYIEYTKDSLRQIFPATNFSQERQIIVDGKNAQAIEIGLIQHGVNFKVLMVLIWDEGEDIWILSLNTTEDKWEEYKILFSRVVESFKIK